jgi:hypothetical protein
MPAQTYSKLNPIENGVLVCVNKEKELYKYVALEDVLFKNKKLKDVLKEKDIEILKLQDRVKSLEASTRAIKNYINFSQESGDDF